MLTMKQQQELRARVRGAVRFDEPLRVHTTIQVGGPADVWIEPVDRADLLTALQFADAAGVAWTCIGRGSNLLVRDGGVRGLVIHLGALDALRLEEESHVVEGSLTQDDGRRTQDAGQTTILYAEAGVKLKRLLGFCAEQGLTGLEGLEGVPGTVGGAIVMNAGTPAGCIGDSVIDIQYLDKGGKVVMRIHEQLEFSYRRAKLPRSAVVLAARLQVTVATPDAVRSRLQALRAQRETAQPGTQPSLGSIFKNPDTTPAWKLIEEAGLKGIRIGGARVSELHGNWIVNEGGATARDVEVLIRLIRDRVKEATGILLEPEITIVGDER